MVVDRASRHCAGQPLQSTEPPRVAAATAAAACFGLLSLYLVHEIHETSPVATWSLAAALLGVLGFSMYRIEKHVHQATCPSDEEVYGNYLMAGGWKFQPFIITSGVCFILLGLMGCFHVLDDFQLLPMLCLAAVGIGLACAAGGRYSCVRGEL